MGWYSDPESRGTGFDSRLAQVIFWSLFPDFWNVLGSALEYCGDLFGQVWEGLTKSSENLKILKILGMGWPGVENVPTALGSIFNAPTAPKRPYNKKYRKSYFLLFFVYFYIFPIFPS